MPGRFTFLTKKTKSGPTIDTVDYGEGAEERQPPSSPTGMPPGMTTKQTSLTKCLSETPQSGTMENCQVPPKPPPFPLQKANSTNSFNAQPSENTDSRARLQSVFVTDDYRNVFRNMVVRAKRGHKPSLSSLSTTERLRAHTLDTTSLLDSQITREQFKELCLKEVALGLSEVEIERVWEKMDVNKDGFVNEEEFLIEAREWRLLRKLASIVNAPEKSSFIVPDNYDYTKSTEENYLNSDLNDFIGDHIHIRQEIDKSYHGNYSHVRQLWQDEAVKRVAVRMESQDHPWVVYTCGAMGAGKGYALSYMSHIKAFPLENIVHIDPDAFKQIMPEWDGYLATNAEQAGTLCHKESGFLQEIAQIVAMEQDQNVWVDGSLRDGDWFTKVFEKLRIRFPHYRVAIFYVKASEDVAWKRCQARAEKTGRTVPRQLFDDSIYKPDRVLSQLTPKVDFVARINNDGATPVLEAYEHVDFSGNWEAISRMFTDAPEDIQERSSRSSLRDSDHLKTTDHLRTTVRTPDQVPHISCSDHLKNAIHLRPIPLSKKYLGKFAASLDLSEFDLNSTLSLYDETCFPSHEIKFEPVRKLLKEEILKLKTQAAMANIHDAEAKNRSEDKKLTSPPTCSVVLAVGEDFVITWSTATRAAAGVPTSAHSARILHPGTKFVHATIEESTRRSSSGSTGSVLHRDMKQNTQSNDADKSIDEANHLSDHPDEVSTLIDQHHDCEGICLLMNGGFLFFDIDEELVGISEFVDRGIDTLDFEECISMDIEDSSALSLRWRRSPLFSHDLLTQSTEKSKDTPPSPAIMLKLACQSRGRLWSTWIHPAELINSKRPCRFGGLAILFHPDTSWLPQGLDMDNNTADVDSFTQAGDRLCGWSFSEQEKIEKKKVVLEKPTVFLFPLKSSHHV